MEIYLDSINILIFSDDQSVLVSSVVGIVTDGHDQ